MSILSRARAVVFDLDGTLVDSNEFHIVAWAEALHSQGLSAPRDALRAQIGKGAPVLLKALFANTDEDVAKAAAAGHSSIFKSRFLDLVRPFPCAHELIRSLHGRGIAVALASASDEKELDHYVRLLDVRSYISARISGDDVEEAKPHGQTFHRVVQELGMSPDDICTIGDTPHDVQAARKAGLQTIVLRSGGYSVDELRAAEPAATYTDVQDLFAHLQNA